MLVVIEKSTGEQIMDEAVLEDMDINPEQNVVTLTVNTDIGGGV